MLSLITSCSVEKYAVGVGFGPLVCTCLWGLGWTLSDQADKDVKHGM